MAAQPWDIFANETGTKGVKNLHVFSTKPKNLCLVCNVERSQELRSFTFKKHGKERLRTKSLTGQVSLP